MDYKEMTRAWLSLFADFLRFFGVDFLTEIADEIDARLAEDAE